MNKLAKAFGLLVVALVVIALAGAPASAARLRVIGMQQAGWTPDEYQAVINEFIALHPGTDIELTLVSYDALHDKLITSISNRSPAYDVVLVDDIWTAQFAEAGWLMDVTDRITPEMRAEIYEAAWDITTYNGKVWGLPWLLDQMYFFYNADMLKRAGIQAPPRTWEELVEQAKVLKAKGIVEYPIVWSWAQIEALICTWVALLYGNGGEFFTAAGEPVFNSPEGVETLQWMIDTLAMGISNPASLSASEEDVRRIMSQGNAAFALNWVYMYDLINDPAESNVVGQIEMALVPVFAKALGKGIESATINGSMGFAVTRYTPEPELAWELVKYMTSKDVQARYADHVTPMWKPLTYQPELVAQHPVTLPMFAQQFPWSHVRPKVPYYPEVSKIVQTALHQALVGQATAQQALDRAVQQIKNIQARW